MEIFRIEQMKKLLILALLMSNYSLAVAEEPIDRLTTFYTTLFRTTMNSTSREETDALCRDYLTPQLIAKMNRVCHAVGADAIIRAQDVSPDMVETLAVKPLSENWYMVSYEIRGEYPRGKTEIPVKMTWIDGKWMLSYIMPEWNNALYGDDLIACNDTIALGEVRQSESAITFLEDFYHHYTAIYCAMRCDLQEELLGIQSRYLSPLAQKQMQQAEALSRKWDGTVGYDLLLDNFDFDPLWRAEITISPLEDVCYLVSYGEHQVEISVEPYAGSFLITSISIR